MDKIKVNYLPEIKALLFGRNKPTMVSVNLTDKCNQNCIYCELGSMDSCPEEQLITKADMEWIIDQMALAGIKRLSMCGGEPFLFQDIFQVVSYAWENSIRSNITSNGMTISRIKEDQLKILKTCKSHINISIDSFNNEIQAKTRGNTSALINAVNSVYRLQSLGIPVTQLTTISRFNSKDLFETVEKAYSLGIKEVLFQPVIYCSNYPDRPAVRNKREINIQPQDLQILDEQLDRILEFESVHAINTNIYRIKPWINAYIRSAYSANGHFFFESLLNKFHCREISAVIDISYTGGIQPCGLALAENFIRKKPVNGLIGIWSESNKHLIRELDAHMYPEICNSCCHKFGRNMMASVLKYPATNRKALWLIMSLLLSRSYNRILKYSRRGRS